jgi:cytochrome c-type biogenesis protein CcmH
MIVSYWLAAISLGVLSSAFIIGPLIVKPYFQNRRKRNVSESGAATGQGEAGELQAEEREHINVGLFEERLVELKSQLDENEISTDEFNEMQLELQKNLLVDTDELNSQPSAIVKVGRLPLVFAALIPLFAIFSYSELGLNWGSISDVELAEELKSGAFQDPARMDQTVEKLAKSLERQPDNDEGWFMLGQLYHGQSEYEKAADIFKRLSLKFIGDSGLASYYAESLFLSDNRTITPRVDSAITKALALNPHDLTMLEIRGMDAFQKGEHAAAHKYFTTALAMANGPRAKLIQQAIERLESQAGVAGTTSGTGTAASQSAVGSDVVQAQEIRMIEVLVELDSSVDVSADSSVFVFAKAITGPPMPLAAQKLLVTELPRLVKLDESMAMIKGMGLANFDLVEVVARISSSGIANASPDDYEARSGQIDITKPTSVVKLTIKNKIKSKD